MRIAIEQTVVYGILMLMLSLLLLFGFTTAEKGVHSLGMEQAVPAMATPGGSVGPVAPVVQTGDAQILGKAQPVRKTAAHKTAAQVQSKTDLQILSTDQRGTKPTWSEQLSRSLEGQNSVVGDAIDHMSLNVGTWMQVGSQKLLGTLSFLVG